MMLDALVDKQRNEFICLTAEDRAVFFDVIEPTMHINSQEQFCQWAETHLQRIFPHGMMACGIGHIDKCGLRVQRVIGCNFPPEYFQTLQCPDGQITIPIMEKWIIEQNPILFEPDEASIGGDNQSEWLNNFLRFGMVNLAAHGQCDVGSQIASYFNFFRIPERLTSRHAYLLTLLMPHLHVTLARVVSNLPQERKRVAQPTLLTTREREILEWLGSGKTNWEIARIFGISEATVKNHVHHILTRLHVGTRAQAVAKATEFNLIRSKERRS